ncbi:UvrD-helicase domain-containing protein [Maridesulfovibrio ferrireducens]|uniref:UvrD-helicase domain-containing protein n=1 Tax=Maridesulfovibrio ferrireducens TaxID=246191 RepID=UPI001A1B1241|nr:UvrD-helicase domain-containing protein [Maridesulfovibrio ferrireducens]MBI9110723.1 UvrD-helicase domain-containing protein [Maridesulfovibrio ferrireducens]
MPKSKCIIAAAGSGKTTYIVKKALEAKSNERVLITTYTQENEKEIRNKIIKKNLSIPRNITVQTWWSFLFQHGVRPYQNLITDKPVKGLKLTTNRSGFRYRTQGRPVYWGQNDVEPFYFNGARQIYSDKIAIFVMKSNQLTKGAVIDRISNLYAHIFVDEVQDLAGYDLDIVHALMKKIKTVLVGDPRQVTYHTHHSAKHKQYKDGLIDQFVNDKCDKVCNVDTDTLSNSYRCHEKICTYSSSLFPDLPTVGSFSDLVTSHDGVFFIPTEKLDDYLEHYEPMQLRYDRRASVNANYPACNFGQSKGLTFLRVVIYPTDSIKKYLAGEEELASSTLCKFYVALTRAIHSSMIVWDDPPEVEGIAKYPF